MEIHSNYTDLLDSNVKEISKSGIFSTMITSLTSKNYCKSSREDFLLSYQKGNSKDLDNKAGVYLDCHSNMLKKIKSSCDQKFQLSHKCLSDYNNLSTIPRECVGQLEDLIQCLNK